MTDELGHIESRKALSGIAVAILAIVAIVLYANTLSAPFLFDDGGAIVNEANRPRLGSLAQLVDVPPDSSFSGRPVVALTVAINDRLHGLDVRGFRAFNIAIHVLCALTLYGVVRRTLSGPRLGARFGGAADGLALAAALVWLVHPVQSECVAYISQRTESTMTLFYLLTLYCAIRARGGRGSGAWCVAAVVACALGMASKEVMVTAPLMVLLHEVVYGRPPTCVGGSDLRPTAVGSSDLLPTCVGGSDLPPTAVGGSDVGICVGGAESGWGAVLRWRWGLYVGLAGTWVVLAALMWMAPRSETVGFGGAVSAWQYALNQCVMLVEYLRITFWPSGLVFDYGVPRALALGDVRLEAVIVGITLIVCIVLLWKLPAVGYPVAWFFVVLAPTSSVVPIVTEVGAERRVYLASAGLLTLAVVLAYAGLRRLWARGAAGDAPRRAGVTGAVLALVCAAGLAVATVQRNREYRSAVAIWTTVTERLPENPRGHVNLGSALAQAGQFEAADAAFARALELDGENVDTILARGDMLLGQRRTYDAIATYEQALRIEPTLAVAELRIARVLSIRREWDKAVRRHGRALALKPDYAQAHLELAEVLLKKDQPIEAVAHYREVMRLRPDWWAPVLRLAWLRATHPDERVRDGAEALQLAQQARSLMPRPSPRLLATQAAAHGSVGDFGRAVEAAESALQMAEVAGDARSAAYIRDQLQSYRAGQAFLSSRQESSMME